MSAYAPVRLYESIWGAGIMTPAYTTLRGVSAVAYSKPFKP